MDTKNTTALTDIRMHDGSRHFASFAQSCDWYSVRDHVAKLSGATLTGFLCDDVTEAWIDFAYSEYAFTINNQFGEYWFFVNDPRCPEPALRMIAKHFGDLLNR